MFGDGSLTFREFAMREPLPLATIQDGVLEYLKGRDDAVLYGAQAVNAYVDKPRMTEDVDIASTRAVAFAEELRSYLNRKFRIAVRIRTVRGGSVIGFIRSVNSRTGIWWTFALWMRFRRVSALMMYW